MIRTIDDFVNLWSRELEATLKLFKHIPDRALGQAVDPEGRTLARLAWHITISLPEMMSRTGLKFEGVDEHAPVPAGSKEIFQAYSSTAIGLLDAVKGSWNDETLKVKDDMYGEQWTRSATLTALILHQVHHRAQMTVLMRQAGLEVPGLYGPARQEWKAYGMQPPAL
jgi:uncharacterized damage-inducible protein DinB